MADMDADDTVGFCDPLPDMLADSNCYSDLSADGYSTITTDPIAYSTYSTPTTTAGEAPAAEPRREVSTLECPKCGRVALEVAKDGMLIEQLSEEQWTWLTNTMLELGGKMSIETVKDLHYLRWFMSQQAIYQQRRGNLAKATGP
jgi:hypothetical protein